MPASELVHHVDEVIAVMPLASTVKISQANGIIATTNDAANSVVAMPFLSLRLVLTGWKVGAFTGWSSVAVILR